MQTRSQGKDQRPEHTAILSVKVLSGELSRPHSQPLGAQNREFLLVKGQVEWNLLEVSAFKGRKERRRAGGGGGEHTSKPSNLHEGIGFNYSLP